MDKSLLNNNEYSWCFACGKDNPSGLHMRFEIDDDKCTAYFTPRREHQSYPGRMHGGLVAVLLDEVTGNYLFAKEGKHIVCGGTTSKIAAEYLHTNVQTEYTSPDPDIPPISHIQGVDLATEGIITLDRVLAYSKDYVKDNRSFENWYYKKDGASLVARILFEDATDINLFVGHAANPAHDGLPINFNVKMQILKQLSNNLQKMGKRVKLLDF